MRVRAVPPRPPSTADLAKLNPFVPASRWEALRNVLGLLLLRATERLESEPAEGGEAILIDAGWPRGAQQQVALGGEHRGYVGLDLVAARRFPALAHPTRPRPRRALDASCETRR